MRLVWGSDVAQLRPQAHAILHIDHMAVLRQPIDQGGGEVVVLQKRAPPLKAKIRSDQSGFFLMPSVHQGKEQSHLNGFNLHVAYLINLC